MTPSEAAADGAAATPPASGGAAGLRDRHCAYYLSLAESAASGWKGDVDGWARTVASDHDNFRAALQWSLARNDASSAIRLCLALEVFWKHARLFDEAERFFRAATALEAGSETSAPGVRGLGRVLWTAARYQDAIELLSAASVALTGGDPESHSAVLVDLGWNHHYAGNPDSATQSLREAVELVSDGPPSRTLIDALRGLGWRVSEEGDHDAAKDMYARALRSAEALGDDEAAAETWAVLANLLRVNGDIDGSERALRESAALYEKTGQRAESIEQMRRLARSLRQRGAAAEAGAILEHVLEIARSIAAEEVAAWSSLDLCNDALDRDDNASALRHAEASALYFAALPELSYDDAWGYREVLRVLAELAYRGRRTADAQRALADATAVDLNGAQQLSGSEPVGQVTSSAIFAAEHGDDTGAIRLFASVLPFLDSRPDTAAGAAWARARIAWLERRVEVSMPLVEEALAIARREGHQEFEARLLFDLGRLACEIGATERGRQVLEEGLAIAAALGATVPQALLHLELGRLSRRDGGGPILDRHHEEVRTRLALAPARLVCEFAEELALHAVAAGRPNRAIPLLASATSWRDRNARPITTAVREEVAAALHLLESTLDRAAYDREWERGRQMKLLEAVTRR